MMPGVVGFIFARGGSKGVPRKNIRPLAGKPLIAWSILAAKESRFISRVIVSTDDDEIARIARQYGAEVPFMRPAELAGDRATEWSAWQHAITEVKKDHPHPLDVFVSIPATSPMRASTDIDACISRLLESDADIVITVKKAERSPYFNMVNLDDGGYAHVVISTGSNMTRRQDAPPVFDMTTVAYAVRPAFIMRAHGIFDGKVVVVEVPTERALDIDTEFDFRIAEFLMKERLDSIRNPI
ncbi:MAG: acylneuraminate cytidylyltransferase family protein [Methanoregula sp.]|jgi:N-acylneuraminate cytidylyltransferase|uniref:acylneuraminate cytidylyltransferase family protein n=1 Tax=Methanoregula sp. TaxID=2052170 RepID=UPI0025FECD16|nr:acylneuraminate cytidylyltransferase family protein [Methanoregula sp.]MCK9630276.1 acylneuraminate cytidylyltransferase family protein [Methanoregula sp.]